MSKVLHLEEDSDIELVNAPPPKLSASDTAIVAEMVSEVEELLDMFRKQVEIYVGYVLVAFRP